jgi:hypothetical protein
VVVGEAIPAQQHRQPRKAVPAMIERRRDEPKTQRLIIAPA